MDKLGGITEIVTGHPFRSSVKESENGNAHVIQLRDVKLNASVDWKTVIKTEVKGRKEPNWLRPNDVIFLARGKYNFSTFIDYVPYKVVCVPHFFVIRVKDDRFLPAFIAWQLNQSKAQSYFDLSAEGSAMRSINSASMKNLDIIHMPIDEQKRIIELHHAYLRERDVYLRLLELRESEMKVISDDLLQTHSENKDL